MRRTGLLILLLLMTTVSLLASEWYENVSYVVSDPFQFRSQLRLLFPHSGFHLGGHASSSKQYVIMPTKDIEKIDSEPNHLVVNASHTLTSSEAASYKRVFKAQAANGEVPWILGAIGSIPGSVTAAVGITSTLLDGIGRAAKANQKVSADTLSELMAEGGRFDLAYIVLRDKQTPSHRYINSSVIYYVSVNNEPRSYIISSSTFALKEE